MEPGKSYTFSITVGKDKATIENVTVEDWNEGTEYKIDGGAATEFEAKIDLTNMTTNDLTTWLNTNSDKIKGKTIVMTGAWKDDFYEPLSSYLTGDNNEDADITLDLSQVTGMTEIKSNSFLGYQGLSGIILSSEVTTINDMAFCSSGLKSIVFPNVTTLGRLVFAFTKIENITIPSGVQEIIADGLANMDNLKEIKFEGQIKKLYGYAFQNDQALTTIDLSNCSAVPEIYGSTFSFTTKSNITVLVKDETMKTAFENDNYWRIVGFKEIKVKGE